MAARRLKRELEEIQNDPPSDFSAGPGNDIFVWKASIPGPQDSPYKDGLFHLDMMFPADYPFSPPHIAFSTKIYHPNVNDNGALSFKFLKKEEWVAAMSVAKILTIIRNALKEPEEETAFDDQPGNQYKSNREDFIQKAKEWTEKYAAVQ